MWLNEILDAIGEHPVMFILLILGVCAIIASIGNAIGSQIDRKTKAAETLAKCLDRLKK